MVGGAVPHEGGGQPRSKAVAENLLFLPDGKNDPGRLVVSYQAGTFRT